MLERQLVDDMFEEMLDEINYIKIATYFKKDE